MVIRSDDENAQYLNRMSKLFELDVERWTLKTLSWDSASLPEGGCWAVTLAYARWRGGFLTYLVCLNKHRELESAERGN